MYSYCTCTYCAVRLLSHSLESIIMLGYLPCCTRSGGDVVGHCNDSDLKLIEWREALGIPN